MKAVAQERKAGKSAYFFWKRVMDLVVSLVAGIILLPAMLIIAVLIRLDSEGMIIFRQERLGKDGAIFTMYKFRTMYMNAEIDGPQLAQENDARCTRVGRLLRKSRLDELPQLCNVLKGDMSLVGPRPERKYFYQKYEKTLPDFWSRLQMRPGITGLAQINGSYNMPPDEKLKWDMKYAEECSILLDIKCLFRTLQLMLTGEGAQ